MKVQDISDFMNMDDDTRDKIMGLSEEEMGRLATVCNRYPVVELSYELSQPSYGRDEHILLDVTLKRTDDDEESL